MGMRACYQMADGAKIRELKGKDPEELFEEIEELQETDDYVLDIDKLWDGLHFLLTGITASEPIADNPLSEAIVGVEMFSDDADADFIAYILPERVDAVLNALKSFEIEKAIANFDPKDFARNGIYPNVWLRDDKEDLKQELTECFNALKDFYENAAQQKKGVIVSIY